MATQLPVLLAAAVLIGGGGVAYGLNNLGVQLLAMGLLAANQNQFTVFWRDAPRFFTALIGLTVMLPILQLVPLPPSLWTALPGRELAVEARQSADAMGWYSLTLDRNRTLVALTGLIAPFAVIVLAWNASLRSIHMAGWIVVACGIVQFAIGVPQVLYNYALFYPENPMPGVLFGTFANRNTTGVFLAICLALAITLPPIGQLTQSRIARLVVEVLLLLAIFLAQSRTAILLAALAAGLIIARALGANLTASNRKTALIAAIIGLAAVAAGGTLLASQTRLAQGFERFSQTGDARYAIWEDATYTAAKYSPVGAGMGTFDEVAYVDESLESLSERPAGRAHNDYLEIAIEAGLPGLALVAAWLLFCLSQAFTARRSPYRWSAWGASVGLLCLALQSITDYPFRTQATLCLAGFLILLLVRSAREKGDRA